MPRRLTALVAGALLLAGCGGTQDAAAPGQQACASLPSADPAAVLPGDFPVLDGVVLYDPKSQGRTQVVFGLLDQGDFVAVRDAQAERLAAAGYTIDGTDQEAVEAEAQFSGPQEGTIQVQAECEGHVRIRYKING